MKARLLSPAGFLLALLCLFFPFAMVSCNGPSGKLSASYTGTDLLLNGSPTLIKSGVFQDSTNTYTQLLADPPTAGVTWLMWIFVVAAVIGLASGFLPVSRNRLILTSGLALLSALLLMISERVALGNLASALFDSQPAGQQVLSEDAIDDLTHTRFGYWVAFFLLIAVAIAPPIVAFIASRSSAAAKAKSDAELKYGLTPTGPPHSGPDVRPSDHPGPPPYQSPSQPPGSQQRSPEST